MAAYRFPYLLAGGSLVLKQESQYYEHFYSDLVPNTHYIEVKRNLSDLVDKIKWAKKKDKKAHDIALNAQKFVNENLLPQHIFCYYVHLLNEFTKKLTSKIEISENMEKVEQVKPQVLCDCNKDLIKEEL